MKYISIIGVLVIIYLIYKGKKSTTIQYADPRPLGGLNTNNYLDESWAPLENAAKTNALNYYMNLGGPKK